MKQGTTELDRRAGQLLERLRAASADRGQMADLRCAWSRARQVRAWPFLGPLGLIDSEPALTVAGGFGYHPETAPEGTFGTACRRLARSGSFSADVVSRRLQRLLAADRSEACRLVRPLILAMRSAGVPVNYHRLFTDLTYWTTRIRQRWAAEFWAPGAAASGAGDGVQGAEEAAGGMPQES